MSARDIQRTVLHYPVLAHVIDAAATGASPTMLTRKALGFGLTSHNSQVEELGAWVNSTEGDIANIACMPDKAQRELSASVVALQVYDFKCHLESSTHWDAARRAVNWLTCQGRVAGRWIQVVPWDRDRQTDRNQTDSQTDRQRRTGPPTWSPHQPCRTIPGALQTSACRFVGSHQSGAHSSTYPVAM